MTDAVPPPQPWLRLRLALVAQVDPDGRVVAASPRWERLLEGAPLTMLGQPLAERFLPDDRAGVAFMLSRLSREARADDPLAFQARLATKDGTSLRCDVEALADPAVAGHVLVLVREALTESLDSDLERLSMLERVLAQMPEAVYAKDLDGRYVYANQAAAAFTGSPLAELLGSRGDDGLDAEEAASIRSLDARVLGSGAPLTYERVHGPSEGSLRDAQDGARQLPRTVRTVTYPLLGDDGAVTGLAGWAQDVSDRRRAEESLRQSEQRLWGILQAIPLPMLVVSDADERIVYANARAADALRTPGHRLVDRALEQVLIEAPTTGRVVAMATRPNPTFPRVARPRPRRPSSERAHRDTRPRAQPGERMACRDDGTTFWVLVTEAEVDFDGEASRLLMLTDITARRRTEEALSRAKLDAEAASVAKNAFLAAMSHEIRTPMNGVLGVASLLERTPLDAQQRGYVETIRRSGDSLVRIIDDILDFSKLEAGATQIVAEPFDLGRLLHEVTDLMEGPARAKGVDVVRELADDLPARVVGDATRLRHVLTNLLSNAVKFTERGSVSLRVEVASRADRALRVRLTVSDTGIGISPEALDRLFEPFVQADSSTTRKFGGTGLGLAICRGLVDAMGGEMDVVSAVGEGSTFTVALPFDPAAPAAAAATPEPSDDAPEAISATQRQRRGQAKRRHVVTQTLSGARVLLAEDHPVNRMVTTDILEVLGCTVHTVEDGEEAVAALARERFDVVLMDCQMPRMDGYEATERIRAAEQARGQPRTPIIAVTAHALPDDRARCEAAGMDDYVTKPIDLHGLRAALSKWARQMPAPLGGLLHTGPELGAHRGSAPRRSRRVRAALRSHAPAPGPAPAPANDDVLDARKLGQLRAMSAHTPGRFRQLAQAYLDSTRQQATELADALDGGDARLVGRLAHRLRGAAGMVGANRVAAKAHVVETHASAGHAEACVRQGRLLLDAVADACAAIESELTRPAPTEPGR